jgi:hypothetical protein
MASLRPRVLTNRQWRRVESRDWLPDQYEGRNRVGAETRISKHSSGCALPV